MQKKKRHKLAYFRSKQGLNQMEMAEKMGISPQYYSYLETGKYNPSFKLLLKFQNVFGLSNCEAWELFDNESDNQ